ncbi:multi-sensor signal transduction histidine kinase [Desulfobulbus propionicus DSM 2032]|uniref:histidine kinase n=1 Tax=Desulfobulbus propionicus (strain ATCC 33891 / DSM 2032 / VKM B-1956 / 1pr3) TaxID=577650 RepID=A0A7U3YN62_DESPD|nr:ATP-binding protein [Desulfobulbus propionicus]ADW18449.1 multi-sensor signal transduction histidine kinase [Desulfobulbus propionicus DSM 2032]
MAHKPWRLGTFVIFVLSVTTVTTIFIVGSLILLIRIPMIEQESRAAVRQQAGELVGRMELLLGGLETRLALVRDALARIPLDQREDFLDQAVESAPAFTAMYLVARQGTIVAAGVGPDLRSQRQDTHGIDLSANPLFRAVIGDGQLNWSDNYLSCMSGSITVGLGMVAGADHVLIAEIPPSYFLDTARIVAGEQTSPFWIVDRRGEVITATGDQSATGSFNLLGHPLLQAAIHNTRLPEFFEYMGRRYFAGLAQSPALKWFFIATAPSGWHNPKIRMILVIVAAAFLTAILIGTFLTPFWARQLLTPLASIITQARQVAEGRDDGAWPRGHIRELNDLSTHLETMAVAIREREQRFSTIFHTSPTAMLVSETDADCTASDVNRAWCALFGWTREQILGKKGVEVRFWQSSQVRDRLFAQAVDTPVLEEVWLLHAAGHPLLCRLSTAQFDITGRKMVVWTFEDVTEIRRMDHELRQLNQELEQRVIQRTEDLSRSNKELSQALADLRMTQRELVRAEKMAALGNLVAGVAHEMNTPIGNGLIAVTTLADQARAFRHASAQGIRRSDLEALLANIDQATDIASRNLHRAADLLANFKQVAVDQTSCQRRSFAVHEVIDEIVTTLKPSLKRTPYVIKTAIPSGLTMDSYPGPLGQVLSNLINNAVLHGFDGRPHGCVDIQAEQDADGRIVLRVHDDGKGIAAEMINRIFDPFVTTRMSSGGTGLGLHIAYNAVTNILGGTLTVDSVEGQGTVFTLRLPANAPQATTETAMHYGLPLPQ